MRLPTLLHPAVVRPGRCLAEIHVGPLPRREAVAWLGTKGAVGPGGCTLAQLYAMKGELEKIEGDELGPEAGQYL